MIAYATTTEDVDAADLRGFFVGWPSAPSPERHLAALRGSRHVVIARDPDTGCVVEFVTAVGDGVLSAFLPLLEVLPEYQGRGIGSELVRRMIDLLDRAYMVDVWTRSSSRSTSDSRWSAGSA